MKAAVNHLPVLTWNHLKLNSAAIDTGEGFASRSLKSSPLPMGIECEKNVGSSKLYDLFKRLGISNPSENVVAGKVPIYNTQSFATGMGDAIDRLMEDTGTDIYTVSGSYDYDRPVTLSGSYSGDSRELSSIFIHAKAGSESTFIINFSALPEECEYLTECGKCEEQKQLLEHKKDRQAEDGKKSSRGGCVGSRLFVYLEEGANLTLHVVQMLGREVLFFNDIGICQEDGSCLAMTKLDLGSGNVFEGLNDLQRGDKSLFSMDMGYLGLDKSSMDINYNDVFLGKKAKGRMYFKEALLGDARKTFRGTLDFRRGSVASAGDEQEDIILLGEDVVNRTIPLILCEEEDVDGRHAATIGSLPDDMLFYMQTRGISKKRAEQMMVLSSLQNISNKVPSEAVRKAVKNSICRVFE